ncbi:MAG: GNAT family N-acetyltransferase [Alphaproteobacteria bacterium]|nr:GNAT family N-acetyltransferase [Alphaproteobacteria bacterium]
MDRLRGGDATGEEILARDPLRNIVLLKHLEAYPRHARLHHARDGDRNGFLVLLDASATSWDRRAYPAARHVVLLSSDGPDLTRALLERVPRGEALVFKLAGEQDRAVVAREFALRRTMCVVSFTAPPAELALLPPEPGVRVSRDPGEAAFALFAAQDHARDWLEPMLGDRSAFASIAGPEEAPLATCFAFANCGPVWEVGGVFTPEAARRRGHGARAVRAALRELGLRGLFPRYQVHEDNAPSIRLAESTGLRPFLHLVHYMHEP